jgi:hypothetical protein
MPSSDMLRHVAVIRTDFSEESIVSIIRVTRIGELGTTLVVTSNRSTLRASVASYCQRSQVANSCHPDDEFVTFLRNVSSYKSHAA